MGTKTTWVMNSTPRQLIEILNQQLSEIENWQLFSVENGKKELTDNLTEARIFFQETLNAVTNRKRMTSRRRNEIRLTMKHYLRLVMVELY